MFEFVKKLFSAVSLFSFVDNDENKPFLILYKKQPMPICTICLIRSSDNPMSLAVDRVGIFFNHGLDLKDKFECSSIKVKFQSCCNFVISIKFIQLFSNPLHCSQIDTQTLWNLLIGSFGVNAKKLSMPL